MRAIISLRFLFIFVMFLVIGTDHTFIQMGINFEKQVILLMTLGSFVFFNKFNPFMKQWYFVVCLYLLLCMLESYYVYRTPLKHLHVFSKILVIFMIFFVYGFYKRFDKMYVADMVVIILIAVLLNAVLVNREAFTLGAFLRNHRGLTANSVYMMIIPLVYFFNKYFHTKNFMYALLFFFVAGIIFFLQHRTAWVSAAAALIINFFLLRRANIKIEFVSLIPIAIFIFLVSMSIGVVIISNEKIVEKIQYSIDQILDPTGNDKDDEVSTSEWRYIQFRAYWPFIEDNFFIGMRLSGYELPVQFVDQNGNIPFEDGTGHHFHSFYIDRLFYQGIVGLLIVILPAVLYIFSNVRARKDMTLDEITLVAFVTSGLLFGMSYILPTYYFGILGYTLFQSEPQKNRENPDTLNAPEKQEQLDLVTH